MTEPARPAGAIYDIGYQHYDGPRLGRPHAVRTLFAHSFRTAFGLGRGERAKLVPYSVTLLCFMPAMIRVAVTMAFGQPDAINYAQHLEFTAFFLALFTAAQAPELVATDRQHGTVVLYLSRPLHATDYMLAKFLALTAAMLVLTLGPQLMMFVGRAFVAEDFFVALRADWRTLLPITGGALGTSVLFSSLGLALSSLAPRRNHASAAVIGFFLITSAVVAIFHQITSGDVRRYVVLAHPVWVMNGFVNWLFDIEARRRSVLARVDLPGEYYLYVILAVCAASMATLVLQYRNRAL